MPLEVKRGCEIWNWSYKACLLLCGYWKLRPGPLQDQLVLLTMSHHSITPAPQSISLDPPYRPEVGRALTEAWACFILYHTYCSRASNREWASSRAKRILQKYLGQPPSYHQIQTGELWHLKCSHESQRNHLSVRVLAKIWGFVILIRRARRPISKLAQDRVPLDPRISLKQNTIK